MQEQSKSTSEKQFVKDLKDKDAVRSVFMASEKLVLTDKNGRPYITVNLNDVSGSINGRAWDKAEQLADQFEVGDLISVKGHVQVYQNRKQVVIHDIKRAEDSQYQLKDFMATSARDPQEMYDQLMKIVEQIQNPDLKKLMTAILTDTEVRPRLLRSPAAKTIHHAYVGGLLEHVLSICGIMKFLAKHYPFLNEDFLIFGAIFHDIGKIWELTVNGGIQYTDRGRLVGHMALACEMIDEKVAEIPGFPNELKDKCKHIVLSHHGRLEYGSPKRPKFLEAMVVAMVDELDSKIDTLKKLMQTELQSTDGSWSSYSPHFDRYFYLNVFRDLEA